MAEDAAMQPIRLALPGILACLGAAQAAPQTYTLDPAHTWVQFELMHFGTSTLRGRIGPVQGSVTLDPEAGGGDIGLRIGTAAVSTGLPVFDARIRQADLLGSQTWPEAYFVASRLRYEGGLLAEVRGEFTLRGTGRPLSLRALRFSCRQPGPLEPAGPGEAVTEVCGGDFEAEIRRSDFGATFGLPFVGDRVRLLIQVEGRR
jgi:polyisoprenoid-binding protein YceI